MDDSLHEAPTEYVPSPSAGTYVPSPAPTISAEPPPKPLRLADHEGVATGPVVGGTVVLMLAVAVVGVVRALSNRSD